MQSLDSIEQEVLKRLQTVIDPELGLNIVDLGMVKDINVSPNGAIEITVGLTIAGCPLRTQIRNDISARVSQIQGVTSVKTEFVTLSADEKSELMGKVRKNIAENSRAKGYFSSSRVLAIASGKGGVGKSTVSVNLAVGLSLLGFNVGLLDADVGGFSIPRLLGIKGEIQVKNRKMLPVEISFDKKPLKVMSMGFLAQEDKAIMWRGLMLAKAFEQFIVDSSWGNVDYLVIDMPPGTSDIQLSLPRLLPHADIIIVTTPSLAAQSVAARVAEMASKSYLRVAAVIENMSFFMCEHKTRYEIFGEGGGMRLSETLGVPLIAQLPIEQNNASYADSGTPAIVRDESITKSAYLELAEVIAKEISPPIEMSSCSARLIEKFKAQKATSN